MTHLQDPDLSHITTFVFDVDGVMTDGLLYCFADGEQLRAFNIKDGFAIKHAINMGYRVAVITGKNEPSVQQRLQSLGVRDLFMGVEDKLDVFENYLYQHDLPPDTVAYMGDDMPDIEVLQSCGLAVCPADACEDVLEICDIVTQKGGGKGAVREFIEAVLKSQDNW